MAIDFLLATAIGVTTITLLYVLGVKLGPPLSALCLALFRKVDRLSGGDGKDEEWGFWMTGLLTLLLIVSIAFGYAVLWTVELVAR